MPVRPPLMPALRGSQMRNLSTIVETSDISSASVVAVEERCLDASVIGGLSIQTPVALTIADLLGDRTDCFAGFTGTHAADLSPNLGVSSSGSMPCLAHMLEWQSKTDSENAQAHKVTQEHANTVEVCVGDADSSLSYLDDDEWEHDEHLEQVVEGKMGTLTMITDAPPTTPIRKTGASAAMSRCRIPRPRHSPNLNLAKLARARSTRSLVFGNRSTSTCTIDSLLLSTASSEDADSNDGQSPYRKAAVKLVNKRAEQSSDRPMYRVPSIETRLNAMLRREPSIEIAVSPARIVKIVAIKPKILRRSAVIKQDINSIVNSPIVVREEKVADFTTYTPSYDFVPDISMTELKTIEATVTPLKAKAKVYHKEASPRNDIFSPTGGRGLPAPTASRAKFQPATLRKEVSKRKSMIAVPVITTTATKVRKYTVPLAIARPPVSSADIAASLTVPVQQVDKLSIGGLASKVLRTARPVSMFAANTASAANKRTSMIPSGRFGLGKSDMPEFELVKGVVEKPIPELHITLDGLKTDYTASYELTRSNGSNKLVTGSSISTSPSFRKSLNLVATPTTRTTRFKKRVSMLIR